jgi:hypothetical protein
MPGRHHKRHANAWDATLTDEQRDQIFVKATQGGFSWEQTAAWIGEAYKVEPPKRDAIYRFLDWWRPTYVARRIQERIFARDNLREQREKIGDMSPELVQSLEERAESQIAAGDLDAGKVLFDIAAGIRDDIRRHLELDLRRKAEERAQQDVQIKLRRLELIERKMAEASDSGTSVDPKALADEIDRTLGRKQS